MFTERVEGCKRQPTIRTGIGSFHDVPDASPTVAVAVP